MADDELSRIGYAIRAEAYKRLKVYSAANGVSAGEVISRLILKHLPEYAKKTEAQDKAVK